MKIKHFGKLALVFAGCLAFAGTSQAAIEVFSNLLVENNGVYNYTGGVKGTPITDLIEVTVVSASHSSVSNASISSIPGVNTSFNGPTTDSSGLNSGQAFQGTAPAAGTFDNVTGPLGAWGETQGFGSIVAPNGGVVTDPFLVNASTVASVDLFALPTSSNGGFADATTGVTAAFVVTNSGAPLSVLIELDAFVNQLVDLSPTPPGVSGSVDNSWSFAVTDAITGSMVFSWSPNGVAGGVIGGVEINDPFTLNTGPSGFPGFTTGPITNSTGGFAAINGGVAGMAGLGTAAPFAASFTLPTGPHSLVIQHSSDVRILSAGIPEPSSCIAWALLSLCAGAGIYRRRRRSKHAS